MKSFKKVLSLILTGVLSLNIFAGMLTTTVYADSSSRIATYINLAKAESVTDVDLSGLTEDQLRFLGVWLSNYFSPFMMEITGDNELTDSIKEKMTAALVSNLSFSEDLAKQLVEVVYGYMKATAHPIYPAYKQGDEWIVFDDRIADDKVEENSTSYATFLMLMSGSANAAGGGLVKTREGISQNTKPKKVLIEHKTNQQIKVKDDYWAISEGYYLTIDGKLPGKEYNSYYLLDIPPYATVKRSDGSEVYIDPVNRHLLGINVNENGNIVGNISGVFDGYSSEEGYTEIVSKINSTLQTLNDDFSNENMSVFESVQTHLGGDVNTLARSLWLWGQYVDDFEESMKLVGNNTPLSKKVVYLSEWGTYGGERLKENKRVRVVMTDCENEDSIVACSNYYTADSITVEVDLTRSKFPSNKGYFVWVDDNGSVHPVADFNVPEVNKKADATTMTADDYGHGELTPSQIAFAECLKLGNAETGYGYSISDFTTQDVEGANLEAGALEYLKTLQSENNLSAEQVSAMTIYGTTMCVDCFGNIIQAGGVHQRVMVPACMNPYAWQTVDSNGEDKADGLGTSRMFANFVHMADVDGINSKEGFAWDDFISTGITSDEQGNISLTGEFGLRSYIGSNNIESGNNDFFNNYVASGSKDSIVSVLRANSANSDFFLLVWFGTDRYRIALPQGTIKGSKLTNVVFVDTLGAYDTGKDFSAFNVASMEENNAAKIKDGSNLFSNALNKAFEPVISWGDETTAAASTLYITYCWASLYENSNKKDTIGRLGYRLAIDNLPSMKSDGLIITAEGYDARIDTITNWVYYLLHPTEGFNYVVTWLTNTINHMLLGLHSSMVGTNGVGVTTGTTKYRSHMGYVTTPDLSEIEWTDALINFYNSCIPFIILVLLIVMVFAFLTGSLSLQHAILGLVLFSIFTVMPVNLINAMVEESNKISQSIYGDKFTYWALVQNETYSTVIDNAVAEGQALDAQTGGATEGQTGTTQGYANYLRTLYNANSMVYTNQGGESILLKWQAPKKMASLVLSSADEKSVSGLGAQGMQMLRGMLNTTYSGQSYTDDVDSVYMYRSYLDITNFSRYIWDYLSTKYNGKTDFNYDTVFKNSFVNDAINNYSDPSKWTMDKYFPMDIDIFNFGLPTFNQDLFAKGWNGDNGLLSYFSATGGFSDNDIRKDALTAYVNGVTSSNPNRIKQELPKLAAHALYSENVYYYFSWKLYADGLRTDTRTGNFKNILLKNNGSYFYDEDSGDLLDVMDMESLFTDVIPYMKKGNDIVRAFDDIYGIYIYDDVPTEEGHWSDAGVSSDPEWKSKYWHNLNVSRLYGIYCPWVDVMYDCSYSKPEDITVMGEKFTVLDPLDPNSYKGSGRKMIFSEKEMHDYGIGEGDLTSAERLILKANREYAERLFELLNYYTFSDVSLDSAAAVNCAFVFNTTFSESGMFSSNNNIYPQSFDLANFSYDAYLRFILANATSEDMLDTSKTTGTSTGTSSGDFYERVVNNSSTVTVLVMIILDVLSIYVIPAFRIFFLVAMFLTSFLIILVSAFRIESNMKFVTKILKQFLLPLVGYFAITVLFSWILSLFMGKGSNAVTQTDNLSISMGDPTIAMVLMIALNVILLIAYFKIIKYVLKSMKVDLKSVGGFLGGLGSATVGLAAGVVAGGIAGAVGGVGGIARGSVNAFRRHRYTTTQQSEIDAIEANTKAIQDAQQGTGIENSRANSRGSTNSSNKVGADDSTVSAEMTNKEKEKFDAINKKAESGNIDTSSGDRKRKNPETKGNTADKSTHRRPSSEKPKGHTEDVTKKEKVISTEEIDEKTKG